MSVRCRRQDQDTLFVKGAPEAVIARCSRVSPHCLSHGCTIIGERQCCCLAPSSSKFQLHAQHCYSHHSSVGCSAQSH